MASWIVSKSPKLCSPSPTLYVQQLWMRVSGGKTPRNFRIDPTGQYLLAANQGIVMAQGGLPHQWFLFANPFSFASFFIYFIAGLAEGNRTPFDLPEAESELVAGFTTEYSGFRYGVFSLAEWTNLYVLGAIVSVSFLGGWNVPFYPAQVKRVTAVEPSDVGWKLAGKRLQEASVPVERAGLDRGHGAVAADPGLRSPLTCRRAPARRRRVRTRPATIRPGRCANGS